MAKPVPTEVIISMANAIVERRITIRQLAKEFGISRVGAWNRIETRLPQINPDLYAQVRNILEYHTTIRHLRGGEATSVKWRKVRHSANMPY